MSTVGQGTGPKTRAERINAALRFVVCPFKLQRILWPHVVFYDKQKEIIRSAWFNDETYVPAGNMLGKDFITSYLILAAFLTRHPCRIVTTSAKDEHLMVLWGELNNWINTSRNPLKVEDGGILKVNHHHIKKMVRGRECPLSYIKGMVASEQSIAAMGGHHIANTGDGIWRTMFVSDESSSVEDAYYKVASPWANRIVAIGNTWDCENFFKRAVKGTPDRRDVGGDMPRDPSDLSKGYYRKVIKITAWDSPNVKLAEAQIANGMEPTGQIVVPGVKSWQELQKNLRLMDKIQQCVSLHADWYEGAEIKLFPAEWLQRASVGEFALTLRRLCLAYPTEAIGIDPAEGGDKTAMAAVNRFGLKELVSRQTPNTAVITSEALAFMRKHNMENRAERVCFDRGGGGKQHADRLREMGYDVQTVAFGEPLTLEPKRGMRLFGEKVENREERYTYVNRRAELFGTLSILIDPEGGFILESDDVRGHKWIGGPAGFSLPLDYVVLHQQLGPIPKTYDREGRLRLLPKNKATPDSNEKTLVELLGCSPDEADATCLGVYGMFNVQSSNTAEAA